MAQPEKQSAQVGKARISLNQVIVVVVVVVLALAGAAVAAGSTSSGTVHYACLTVNHSGNTLTVTTSGLIHIQKGAYYISCNEGTTLPTTSTTTSCLTITPKGTVAPYPGSQTTTLYYLTVPANAISVQGAAANATEIFQPTSATITINCG